MRIMGLNFAIYVKLIGNYGEHRRFGFANENSVTSPSWHLGMPHSLTGKEVAAKPALGVGGAAMGVGLVTFAEVEIWKCMGFT